MSRPARPARRNGRSWLLRNGPRSARPAARCVPGGRSSLASRPVGWPRSPASRTLACGAPTSTGSALRGSCRPQLSASLAQRQRFFSVELEGLNDRPITDRQQDRAAVAGVFVLVPAPGWDDKAVLRRPLQPFALYNRCPLSLHDVEPGSAGVPVGSGLESARQQLHLETQGGARGPARQRMAEQQAITLERIRIPPAHLEYPQCAGRLGPRVPKRRRRQLVFDPCWPALPRGQRPVARRLIDRLAS